MRWENGKKSLCVLNTNGNVVVHALWIDIFSRHFAGFPIKRQQTADVNDVVSFLLIKDHWSWRVDDGIAVVILVNVFSRHKKLPIKFDKISKSLFGSNIDHKIGTFIGNLRGMEILPKRHLWISGSSICCLSVKFSNWKYSHKNHNWNVILLINFETHHFHFDLFNVFFFLLIYRYTGGFMTLGIFE